MVTSDPAGAKVFAIHGTELLGVTPYTYEVTSSMEPVSLRIELEGYVSEEVSLPGNRDGAAHLVLRSAPARQQADETRPRKPSPNDPFEYR